MTESEILPLWADGFAQIFALHRLVEPRERSSIPVNRELELEVGALERILLRLQQEQIEVVTLDALAERLESGNSARCAVFTFDDGYKDVVLRALPLFERLGLPFTLYLTTDFPDKRSTLWWYGLERALKRKGLTPSALAEAFFLARERLLTAPAASWPSLFAEFEIAEGFGSELTLDWEEVARLCASSLVTLGSHTRSHPSLARLTAEEATIEMVGADRRIRAAIGREVRHFCYPFGTPDCVTPREVGLAQQIGYRTATTTERASVRLTDAVRLLALPRWLLWS